MFSLHDFVIDTIFKMIGIEPDYRVQRYALGWYEKEVLVDEDMVLIEEKIAEKNTPIVTEEVVEEATENIETIDETVAESEAIL